MSELVDERESTAVAVGDTKRRKLEAELEFWMRTTASETPGRRDARSSLRNGMCSIMAPVPLNDNAGRPPKRRSIVEPTRLRSGAADVREV